VTNSRPVVCRVESLFALADATAQFKRTNQAILAKAIRGELTPEE